MEFISHAATWASAGFLAAPMLLTAGYLARKLMRSIIQFEGYRR